MGNMGGYVEGFGYLLDGTHVNGIFEGGDLEMESRMSGKMGRLKKWQNIWLHYGPHFNPSHSGEMMTHGSIYLSTWPLSSVIYLPDFKNFPPRGFQRMVGKWEVFGW